jgi:hypothetical protein
VRHGYTNDTATDGRVVTKQYAGPDAGERQRREVAVLTHLADVLPVPPLRAAREGQLVTGFVVGTHGQELLDAHPEQVLALCGRLARNVHDVDRSLVPELGEARPGQALVHGDFGPQNVLIDPEAWRPVALLDWEFTRFGDPIDDLAWAEWIVRTHHPAQTVHLHALFDGYGDRPSWTRRHDAMARACERLLDFVTRWTDNAGAVALWRERIRTTERFSE